MGRHAPVDTPYCSLVRERHAIAQNLQRRAIVDRREGDRRIAGTCSAGDRTGEFVLIADRPVEPILE
jgi:hypothetical protein